MLKKLQPQLLVDIAKLGICSSNTNILEDINLRVKRGETVAILGHNGAGKTSLLRSILGMFKITSGNIRLFGISIKNRSTEALYSTGALLHTPSFYEKLTVLDHLKLVQRLRCVGDVDSKNYLKALIDKFTLHSFLDKSLSECSSGMRKRVAIASAMIGNPELIILDDPFAELDTEGITQLKSMLGEVRQKKQSSIILTTHSLSLARALCDVVLVLEDGRIVFNGNWEEFDAAIGSLYKIQVDKNEKIVVEFFPASVDVRSLAQIGDDEYLINIHPAKIKEAVKYLIVKGYGVLSVVQVPFSSKEFTQQLRKTTYTKKHNVGRNEKENTQKARYNGNVMHNNTQNKNNSLLTMIHWEMKNFYNSTTWWVIPIVIVLMTLLSVFASIPIQKGLFNQQVSIAYLLSNVMTGLCIVGSIMMAIACGISMCKDYSENRLRFLFVLPVKNSEIIFSKILVWNIIVVVYLLLSIYLIGGVLCIAISSILGYSWMLEETGLSFASYCIESMKILPILLISYAGIGLFCITLGTIIKKTIPTLSISVLTLVVSFIVIPGFRISMLPFTDMIIHTGETLLTMGNGILPFSSFISPKDMLYSLILAGTFLVVALTAFSKKVW